MIFELSAANRSVFSWTFQFLEPLSNFAQFSYLKSLHFHQFQSNSGYISKFILKKHCFVENKLKTQDFFYHEIFTKKLLLYLLKKILRLNRMCQYFKVCFLCSGLPFDIFLLVLVRKKVGSAAHTVHYIQF